MPLILAIEPDRRQSTKLAMLARNQLHADLVITDSVEQALAALDEVVPDLILTSPLIPSRDGIALADRLRELDAEGLHVRAVVIPALAVPGQRVRTPQRSGGTPVRGRNLSNPSSGGGCDPVVFGMQLVAHLDRAGIERHAEPRASASAPQITRAPAPVAVSQPPPRAEDVNVDIPKVETVTNVNAAQDQDRDRVLPDWSEVLSAMHRDIEQAHLPALAALQAVAPLAVTPPAVVAQSTSTPEPAVAAADVTRKRRRRPTPPQDEWGFFDPAQCGVSALIAKVNEITGHTTGSAKKPA
jgi:CheY-like chemotaxis protein